MPPKKRKKKQRDAEEISELYDKEPINLFGPWFYNKHNMGR